LRKEPSFITGLFHIYLSMVSSPDRYPSPLALPHSPRSERSTLPVISQLNFDYRLLRSLSGQLSWRMGHDLAQTRSHPLPWRKYPQKKPPVTASGLSAGRP
jgi:hypothetical protein